MAPYSQGIKVTGGPVSNFLVSFFHMHRPVPIDIQEFSQKIKGAATFHQGMGPENFWTLTKIFVLPQNYEKEMVPFPKFRRKFNDPPPPPISGKRIEVHILIVNGIMGLSNLLHDPNSN